MRVLHSPSFFDHVSESDEKNTCLINKKHKSFFSKIQRVFRIHYLRRNRINSSSVSKNIATNFLLSTASEFWPSYYHRPICLPVVRRVLKQTFPTYVIFSVNPALKKTTDIEKDRRRCSNDFDHPSSPAYFSNWSEIKLEGSVKQQPFSNRKLFFFSISGRQAVAFGFFRSQRIDT